ncbi:WhiB family transcriptional regulator [Micrococcus luteus]|uniref:WhiB family transcriptional regulator n=1 Tax=Micrococcus luteus TaxID=1270 RepID=UPI00080DB881|nr:WhiB family transcriptional regulator [Micrococcus luteus]
MTDMTETLAPSRQTEDGVERTPCQLADPDIWFTPSSEAEAVAACRQCPAHEACLRAAMDAEGTAHTSSRFGVWGGLTPMQRSALHRADRPGRRPSAEAGDR